MQSSAWGAAHPHYGMALEDLFDENPGADFLFLDRIAYWRGSLPLPNGR
jgi:hypothetical protein